MTDNKKLKAIIDELRDMIKRGGVQLNADQRIGDNQRIDEIEKYLHVEIATLSSEHRDALQKMVDVFTKTAMEDLHEDETEIAPLPFRCYHYILDEHGNPVHCEDELKVIDFYRREGHILAGDLLKVQGRRAKITTALLVHNPVDGDEVPPPRWVTTFSVPGLAPRSYFYVSEDEAMHGHSKVIDMVRGALRRKRGCNEQ